MKAGVFFFFFFFFFPPRSSDLKNPTDIVPAVLGGWEQGAEEDSMLGTEGWEPCVLRPGCEGDQLRAAFMIYKNTCVYVGR